MRMKSEKVLSDVQKIWFRVMSIYYQSENRTVRIPSSNELAKEFGIAGTTVRLALKKLEKEGYLIMRKGSGTFTNRVRAASAGMNRRKPLIGLLLLSGDLFFYPPPVMEIVSAFSDVLSQMDWNVRFITERCTSPEEVEVVLRHSYLDGLICVSVGEGVAEKAAELLPTVNLNFDLKGVPSVYSAYDRLYRKLLELTGRDHDIHAWLLYPIKERYPLIRYLSGSPGIKLRRLSGETPCDCFRDRLRKQLAECCPDWLILEGEQFDDVRAVMTELYGEERSRSVLWIFWYTKCADPSWPGLFICADNRHRAHVATDMLKRLLADPAAAVPSQALEAMLIRLPGGERLI